MAHYPASTDPITLPESCACCPPSDSVFECCDPVEQFSSTKRLTVLSTTGTPPTPFTLGAVFDLTFCGFDAIITHEWRLDLTTDCGETAFLRLFAICSGGTPFWSLRFDQQGCLSTAAPVCTSDAAGGVCGPALPVTAVLACPLLAVCGAATGTTVTFEVSEP